jgi:hypothetical protein
MIREHSQANHGVGRGESYFSDPAFTFNQYDMIKSFVETHTGMDYTEDLVKSLLKHR